MTYKHNRKENILIDCKNQPLIVYNLDNLDAKFFKLVTDLIVPTICRILNQSLSEGQCPCELKIAIINPLRIRK